MRTQISLCVVLMAGAAQGLFSQVLYIPNQPDGVISTYIYNTDAGTLVEVLPRLPSGGAPTAIAIHPNKKFAYVANGGRDINPPSLAGFSIDPSTGLLNPVASAPLIPGSGPAAVAIDPTGSFAFVAHQGVFNGASTVTSWAIDPVTGGLTAVPGSPFTTAPGASSLVVHPNGKFVYVAGAMAGQIAAFNLGADGGLSPANGSPFAARTTIAWMAMDPAGKFLFAVERQDNAILAYSVDASTGALTPVPGSPFSPGPSFLTGVAVDPAGKFLYVSNAGGVVLIWAIGDGGALTQRGFAPAVIGANAVILDPAGKFLYTPGTQTPTGISAYSIDAGSGALTSLGDPYPTGAGPQRGAAVLLDPPVLPPMSVDSVVNFHSRSPRGMPNSALAQGSRIAITGKNIGPGQGVTVDDVLPTNLGGVSAQIQSGDVTSDVLMVYASATFLNGVIPSSTPLGDATLTVIYNGRTSAPVPITVTAVSVGLRILGNGGYGPAKAWNVPADAPLVLDESLIQIANAMDLPAKPGQRMVIQGTGLGAVSVDETAADYVQPLDVPVNVVVGNKPATVLGMVRASWGSDYIVFQLADDVPAGCLVPVAVQAGGVTSNVVSVSISADGGPCSDETGFSASDIALAQKNDGLTMGEIEVVHLDIGGVGVDNEAIGRFGRSSYGALSSGFAPTSVQAGVRGSFAVPPLGSCTVTPGEPTTELLDISGDKTPFQPLNVGQNLNLTGPNGTVQLAAPGYRFGTDDDIFKPGDYTVDNGAGAAPFGPFKAAITLPDRVTLTNPDVLGSPVDRSQDLTLTWSGGAADKEFAMLVGLSQNQTATAAFLCTAKVADGTFTIPAWVLSNLPASTDFTSDGQTITAGFIGLVTAPLTSAARFSGMGLDFGIFTYEQGQLVLVPLR